MYVHTNYWWLNEKKPTKHGILIVPYKINHPEKVYENQIKLKKPLARSSKLPRHLFKVNNPS